MKGWTVRTEATKNGTRGVAGREVYLNNKEHPNHRNTERIHSVFGTDRSMSNISYSGESYAAKQKANGKGGRPPSSYAVEFTLNLPKGYRPSDEQWRKIVEHCLVGVAKTCGVTPKQIAQTCRAVLHQQKQDGSKQGTGDHCHVIVGKFTQDGMYLRNLQRKTVTAKIKQCFNEAVKRHCDYDWTEYAKHLQEQRYPNKRPAPTWKVRANREREALEEQQKALSEQVKAVTDVCKQMGVKPQEIEAKIEEAKEVARLTSLLMKQSEKWLKAFESGDQKQINRQQNRVQKTIDEIDAFTVSDETKEQVDNIVKLIEAKTGKAVRGVRPPVNTVTPKPL
ncbi:hypothetical protein [Vibrio breoganii]|uniref:hypothetical protein n=1 Tax=Vibrio breoganii TaxID=553239 RepID=UPI0002E388AF|nr:hypothetical protein [Vibrio breoganii]OEF81785.1 hypothetical protein B003_12195 [Vibrio breoganii 1C10]